MGVPGCSLIRPNRLQRHHPTPRAFPLNSFPFCIYKNLQKPPLQPLYHLHLLPIQGSFPTLSTFQRSNVQRNLSFQSLPHSFAYRAPVFNNLRTLCNVKFRLSPTESIIPALLRKNTGVVWVCRRSRRWGLFQRPQTFQRSNVQTLRYANLPTSSPNRAIQCQNSAFYCNGVQYAAIPCTTQPIPTFRMGIVQTPQTFQRSTARLLREDFLEERQGARIEAATRHRLHGANSIAA